MAKTSVEFKSVGKVYRTGVVRRKRISALSDVTLSVPAGTVFGVIGPNRAGKTTLVKALLSLCRLTSGSIVRLGRPASDRSTLARIGYVHENQAFPPYLTATALLRYYGALSLVPRRELGERIPKLLAQVGLADRTAEPISTFSKGMVQRLALAQALVNDPELLVLDEPAEGMDLMARRFFIEVVKRHRNRGRTAVLVSHSLTDVRELCDEVAVLRAGRLVFNGSLSELTGDDEPDVSAVELQEALEPMYVGGSA